MNNVKIPKLVLYSRDQLGFFAMVKFGLRAHIPIQTGGSSHIEEQLEMTVQYLFEMGMDCCIRLGV
jgi:hypothetical protein